MTNLTNATTECPTSGAVATQGTPCPTCEGRKVEVVRGLEYQCDTCQGFGTVGRPPARLTGVEPARRSATAVRLDAHRRTRDAARLAELLAGKGVTGPEAVEGLSELGWSLAASCLQLPDAPDARLRAAVADAFRVTAGAS